MGPYTKLKEVESLPRIPLEGNLDLTYRCNNNCRHCWVGIPKSSDHQKEELTFDETIRIVHDARKMGCRQWLISGGEPMLRPDFPDIFDYLTRKSTAYSLNTNGTLITPPIARLLRRKGRKMVAIYGATAEIHDHITRAPGSFEATLRGISYLGEAGAGFIAQLVPMKDNYYQFRDMVSLAESLTPHWRIGAPWLYLRADGDRRKNREIIRQRLAPADVLTFDWPDPFLMEPGECAGAERGCGISEESPLFAACINSKRDFHIDPYGRLSFCPYLVGSQLRFDLKTGSFKDCWERFIPSLVHTRMPSREYREGCGSCEFKHECRWCPVYGYLEKGRFSAKVDYLCDLAKATRRFREEWVKSHRRYYQIAGITIRVDSDLPIKEDTFHPKFKPFEVAGPGEENMTIRHYFSLPQLQVRNLGTEVHATHPWAIYQKEDSWIYLNMVPGPPQRIRKVARFSHGYERAAIYHETEEAYRRGNLPSLTLFSTDQILLAPFLANRKGCYFHAGGLIFQDAGFLFVGHSNAGKSTIVSMFKDRAEVLSDDRVIVRWHPEGFRIYGSWSHGEVPAVSPASAPLQAIFFLKKARETRVVPTKDRKETLRKLLACLIKPFATAEWWKNMLSLVEMIMKEVPCYTLHFQKEGKIAELVKDLMKAEHDHPSPRQKTGQEGKPGMI